MTQDDIDLLQRCVDRILAIELTTGEQFFAEVLFVFTDGESPDVFYLRCLREADGAFIPQTTAGESTLLTDIRRIALIPGIDYPEVNASFPT